MNGQYIFLAGATASILIILWYVKSSRNIIQTVIREQEREKESNRTFWRCPKHHIIEFPYKLFDYTRETPKVIAVCPKCLLNGNEITVLVESTIPLEKEVEREVKEWIWK